VWGAMVLALVVLSVPGTLIVDLPAWLALPCDILLNGIAAFVLVRYGLLAGIVTMFVVNHLLDFPLTVDLSSWTAAPTLWLGAFVLLMAVYGFRTALAGRPALMAGLLTD